MPNKKTKAATKALAISPSSQQYSGPTRMPLSVKEPINDQEIVQLNLIGTIAASGAGVIATVFDCYSQASSSPEWATFISLFSEFRILSMDLEVIPWNKYNTSTTSQLAPIYSVEDRQNATALASLNDVMGYISVEAHQPTTRFRRVVRMQGSGEADFTSSASSPNSDDRFFLKLYSAGNTASLTTHDYLNRIMVQFRNRK
jgi:hypothetical protein